MKKSVCLMAILGAFCATGVMANPKPADHNQMVSVKFTGKVIESSCAITVGDAGVVDLGTYNITKQTAPMMPIQFKFSDCTNANSLATVSLVRDGGLYPEKGNKDEHRLSTNQKGLAIQLYSDLSGSKKGFVDFNQTHNNTLVGGKGTVVVAWAKLEHTKTDNPTKGTVEGLGIFEVTFN